jgi:uncharacterized membrane protein
MSKFEFDRTLVREAIAAAESRSSGEIRVVVCADPVKDALEAARSEFTRLNMQATRERNAVLILVAPASQNFAIIGDQGVDARCGTGFWQTIAADMGSHFGRGQFTDGMIEAVRSVGEVLAKYFPRSADDQNELPDDVVDRPPVI